MAREGWSTLVRATIVIAIAVAAVAGGSAVALGASPGSAHRAGPTRASGGEGVTSDVRAARSAVERAAPQVARPADGRTPAQASLDVDREGPRLFPPNPDLPSTAPGASSAVSPYLTPPAPMGISDFGVGANGAYAYTTTSFEGFLNVTSFGAFSPTNVTNLSTASPDWVLLELDAVAVNVSTLPAAHSANATFWVENGLQLNATTAQLEDNVWNFSVKGALLPSSSLSGSRGSILGPSEVYAGIGPTLPVTYPLSIELKDNISVVGEHTVVTFGYVIGSHSGVYDTVTFNGSSSASAPPQFLVDGSSRNPNGSYYDVEFVLGGDGYGSNADLNALNATASLLRWNLTSGSYASVPSAFDFGVDSSETALGVAVAYTGTTVQLSPGPSFLDGLWGTDGPAAARLAPYVPAGSLEIQLTVVPSYAFLFANATLAGAPQDVATYSFAPTSVAGGVTTYLPPLAKGAVYDFAAWADGYASSSVPVNSSTAEPVTLSLTSSPGTMDAPVYLRGSAQVAELAAAKVAHTGYSAATSTLWLNASPVKLAPPFLRTNEAYYPNFELVASLRLQDDSLVVNGLTLAPGTENYTTSSGHLLVSANWTQGYFFFYGNGKGRFTVENTTIQGNLSLAEPVSLTLPWGSPPSTVELFKVVGSRVTNLSAIDDSVGVTAVAATGANVTNLSVASGALGLFAYNSTEVGVVHASASGHDPVDQAPSSVLEAVSSGSVVASDLSVAEGAVGLWSLDVDGLAVSSLTVTSGSTGFLANFTNGGTVDGLVVGGGGELLSEAGSWGNSSDLAFQHVTIAGDGLGLSLYGDTGVTVDGGTSTGLGASVVQLFLNSTKGTFQDLEAENGSVAANLQTCTDLNVSGITAINNSTGAFVANASGLSGTGFVSELSSLGLWLNNTTEATFSGFAATDDSAGIDAQNSTSLKISNVSATNTTFDNVTTRFATNFSGALYVLFPIAGVGLTNDTTVTVSDVSSASYPFAVWTNHSSRLTISEVTAWDANVSVSLNWTNASTVQEIFSWGAEVGLLLANSTGTTVGASSFEASAGVGLALDNGSGDAVSSDNFLGNDNASYRGVYNASRYQARSNNSSDPTFKGDFWSDWNGSASYTINASDQVSDGHPLSSFYATYLAFTEKGLPVGTNWSLAVDGHSYYLPDNAPLYLPGWIFPGGAVPYSVVTIYDYPAHPASGSVSWSGSSQSVQIFFGNLPASGFSLPLWLLAAIGAGAAAAAVGALLVLRRRKGRAGPPPPATTDPFGAPAAPPSGPGSSPPPGGTR